MSRSFGFLLALSLIVSCDALRLKDRGGEGDACFTDNTCNEPYHCIDGKCVNVAHIQDDDIIDETDDELVVGDDEGEADDQPDQSDVSDQSDGVVADDDTTDEDVGDDDATDDLSDQSDPSDVDDTVIVADNDVVPVDDAVTPDDDTTDVTPTDDAVVPDDDVVATMAVLCTGQTKCYDATAEMTCPTEGNNFYGQDAQYAVLGYCMPRDYTVSGTYPQEIVTDNVTGLIWQRTRPGMVFTWDEAVYACEQPYGGYNDWRLPSLKELASLIDYGHSNPSVDLVVFPDTGSGFFWSSSSLASNNANAWRVYFYQGAIDNNVKTSTANAWCVRGQPLPASSFTEATVSGKVLVTDLVTGFVWSKEYSGDVSWQGALNYCETLNYGGATDWRLPNIVELQTLVDDASDNPASNFPEMPAAGFWSSSTDNAAGNRAWIVAFDSGVVSNASTKTASTHARCVRSDPTNECVTQDNPCDDGGDTGATCADETVGYSCNCSLNYSDDGVTCAADTRTYTCAAKPLHTVWNSVSEYEQTWDGSVWLPADDPTTDYNPATDTASCRYKCAAGYYWNGSYCVNNKVVCTGQTKCYDNSAEMTCPSWNTVFTGQDAQYLVQCEPRDYSIEGAPNNDVVVDNRTELMWQRTFPPTYAGCTGGAPAGTKCTWQEAVDHCDGLTYGGYDDWRLPSREELATLPDYGKSNPAIDTVTFPDTQSSYYWTSSVKEGASASAWFVYFYHGYIDTTAKTNPYYVRCVRGEALLPDSAFTEATVEGKVIVTDAATGLQWTKEYSSSMDWQAALNYCETLNYGDAGDWRLPNINELAMLVDDTASGPASAFPGIAAAIFWSSSTSHYANDDAWYVNFDTGLMSYDAKTAARYALCVRSPVDECTKWSNPCNDTGDSGGTCTDTPTGYTCECTDYYFNFFNGSCRDIDECMSIQFCNDNGDTLATCTNTSPGYDCGCSEGFEISYTTYPATPEYPTCVALPPPTGVLCTGQTLCYNATEEMTCPAEGNAFYGQDAQYALLGECVPRDYTVSGDTGDDIITDNVTGLIWQRTLPATYAGCTGGAPTGATCAWQQSIDYCNGLIYAGQSDWRLPTRRELATLSDYGRHSPAIDVSVFPGTQSSHYWSSSSYASSTDNAWTVSSGYGSTGTSAKTNANYVRCVRGEEIFSDSVFTEETLSGKVVVADTVTGLQWTKEYATSVNWQNALGHCEGLNYGGHTDWRLPNMDELKTLINDTIYSPASTFPDMPSQDFWSSSSYVGNAETSWRVGFDQGLLGTTNKSMTTLYARCVR